MSDNELVVGCSNGRVHVLNLSHGSQQDLAVDKARVSAVSISEARLLVGTVEGQLFEFARVGKDGALAPASRLVQDELGTVTALVSQENTAFVATKDGTRVKALDTQTGAAIAKWPKCSAPPVSALVKTGSGNEEGLLISFNDRQIHFARSPKDICALMGKSKPVYIEVNRHRGQKVNSLALAVEENGPLFAASHLEKSSETQLRPISIIKISDDALKIFAAAFSDQNTIAITYGSKTRPSFDTITFADKSGAIEAKINVKPSTQSLLPEGEDANKPQTKESKKLDENAGKFTIVNPFDLKVPQLNQLASETAAGSEESAVSFGERMKAQLSTVPAISKGPAKVESIDAALLQALKTKDQDLLNRVFQTTNAVLVKRTVEKLPQNSVLPLLLFSVEKFQTNPSMASHLTIWINAVLTIHLAYLMSLPTLPKSLGPLYSVIESRMAVFQDLLKLQGRLDLLVSQIDRRRSSSATLSTEPAQVYREGDEDEDSIEADGEDDEGFEEESDDNLLNDDDDDVEGGGSDEEMEDASD